MACALTTGFALGCKDQYGGIAYVCLAAWSSVVATGLAFDSSTGEVEDLPTGLALFSYAVDDLAGNFGDIGSAEENGAFVYNPELVFRLRGMTAAMRKEFELLIKNRVVAFVVPHRGSGYDKKIFAIGLYRGLQVTSGGFEHGAGLADFSGLNVTLSGQQAQASRLVEAYTALPFDNAAFSLTVSPAFVAAEFL